MRPHSLLMLASPIHRLSLRTTGTRGIRITAVLNSDDSKNKNVDNSPSNNPSRLTPSGLDPDKIKGPGGLTMSQISRLVQESHSKDAEHMKKKQQQQQQTSQTRQGDRSVPKGK
ncbi:hypothetical protein BGW38_004343 [Lunasporangiospora selenospora]|uniref:Uncharacterized protein n=1 Tax=Lunasporangiospora selenospora TaxID=979761 RepID=A0A9P6KHE1_9FUNG|nr:hypothetical protein BGW38_004343 [Lunasporangiospora selenospora]